MKSIFKGDDDMSYAESTLEQMAKDLKIAVFQIDDSVLHTPTGKEFSPGDRVNVNVACIAINRIAEEIEKRHRRHSLIVGEIKRETDEAEKFINEDVDWHVARHVFKALGNIDELAEEIATHESE